MNKNIPTYQLNTLSKNEDDVTDIFFLDQQIKSPGVRIDIPFRRNFYAVGICVSGRATLKANLETYAIEPGCLITKPPYTINQWTFMSHDFETLTVFFTKDFITTNNFNPDKFKFFESFARHVFQVPAEQSGNIIASLNLLRQKYDTGNDYRNEILRNQVTGLLYEIASIYDQQSIVSHSIETRSQSLTSDFKRLVNLHFSTERSLNFYAKKLFITSKHLTETVKEVTGKTAGEWIEEAVVLEAKVLLQTPSFNVAQISDMLHFTDQSAFGRYFKNNTGLSPIAYKQAF